MQNSEVQYIILQSWQEVLKVLHSTQTTFCPSLLALSSVWPLKEGGQRA